MTYVVTDKCIRCKYTDCVNVCPGDGFYEGRNMLVIDPEVCIACGVCVPECPAEAIVANTDPAAQPYLELNRRLARRWPNITTRKPPPPDAAAWDGVPDKYPDQCSEDPGRRRVMPPSFGRGRPCLLPHAALTPSPALRGF